MMEGQFFFTTVAGLSLSLVGFAALIFWLRDGPGTWDPISLWRVKTIVRHGLTLVFLALALIPIYTLTNDIRATTRFGAAGIILFELVDVFMNRDRDPEIWQPRVTWTVYLVGTVLYVALQTLNLWLASLGLLMIGYLLAMASPAGIFSNFVRELGRRSPELSAEASSGTHQHPPFKGQG
jgi:hypothetical protein